MPQDTLFLETELLVVRWQRGDRAAFDHIVGLWERSLYYYLRRLARSEEDAWELTQETWLKVLKSLRGLRDPRSFPAFLYRTARNAAMTRLRSPEFHQLQPDDQPIGHEREFDPIADLEHVEQVHHALDQLSLLQREALTLFFLRELSLEEMSVLLGIPIGTVKSRLHYARQAIRKLLLQGDTHARPSRGISSAAPGCSGNLPHTSGGI